jgi:ribosomal protein L15E
MSNLHKKTKYHELVLVNPQHINVRNPVLKMSNLHKKTKYHELVLVNPQHINVRNPVNEGIIKSQQEKANMITSLQKRHVAPC